MKLRKIFAGMAASAIAMSMFAVSASALDQAFNAGICFQTSSWTYRNAVDKEANLGAQGYFPTAEVGCNGDGGFDTAVAIEDVQIQYDGTYTVSLAANGTVNDSPKETTDKATGEVTSTLGNGWGINGDGEVFNMLLIGTDLLVDEVSDETGHAIVNGQEVICSDITASWGSNTYTLPDAYAKADNAYATFAIINSYDNSDFADALLQQDSVVMPAEGEIITITFTISGLGEDPNAAAETPADTTETPADTTETPADTTETPAETTETPAATTETPAASDNTVTTTAASDNVDNSATGATAGLALAGIALAGAAIVVTKRK